MAKLTTDEIIDALKEMTLLEASELVKAIEDTFGVSCRCCRRSRCWRC